MNKLWFWDYGRWHEIPGASIEVIAVEVTDLEAVGFPRLVPLQSIRHVHIPGYESRTVATDRIVFDPDMPTHVPQAQDWK